jgi:hypothetical protein
MTQNPEVVDYTDCDEWEMLILFGEPEEDEEF